MIIRSWLLLLYIQLLAMTEHGFKPFQLLNCDELEEILLDKKIKPEVCQVLKGKAFLMFS